MTARLIATFRLLPATPIYAASRTRIEPALVEGPIDGLELILATSHYLGQATPARARLLAYARARADGSGVAALCRERGWARATLYRHVTRAAETVARGLNLDRKSGSTLLPVRHLCAPG